VSWPLHSLSLTTPDLELRVIDEATAVELAAVAPDDLAYNPKIPSLGHDVLQNYWRSMGQWRVDDWVLPFVVLRGGEPLGVQALEGKDFLVRRVVDSYSWLVRAARGQGVGKQMRTAILELAFSGLGARHAISEAYEDNTASLSVSRALGYKDNGVTVERRDGGEDTVWSQHLLLSAEAWRPAWDVTISGLEPCLPLFGL
jgi:RimJ/RimL family protein N-acetyltransferase